MKDTLHALASAALKAALASALIGLASPGPAAAQASPVGAEEARAIGVEAYLYFYPLVSMDVTRRQMTNVEAGKGFGAPMNVFANIRAYPGAADRAVVRPNFDTLYSAAFLDLREEPVVVSVPDTKGRYYLLPMLDMWTDVFASPGWRTTGTAAGHFLLVDKNWRRDARDRAIADYKLPSHVQVIEAPTPHVWIIGRTKTDGPDDYPAVHEIQNGFRLTPASQWGREAAPAPFKPDPSVDMVTPPKTQVDTMPADRYFAYAADLLKLHPPHATDQPIVARMKRIGIEPGKSFDFAKVDEAVRQGLQHAVVEGQRLMGWKVETLASVVNGWSMNLDTMGVYGNYYLKRAIIAQVGLGANLPEDAIYPLNLADSSGQPLDGAHRYRLHFPKDGQPPAEAFWSVTLYDPEGFQTPNALNRYAVSSWMPFRRNPDGSLDLLVQHDNPGKAMEANWLPAPKGPFNLTMRLYAPRMEALTGRWAPPPVQKITGAKALAQ